MQISPEKLCEGLSGEYISLLKYARELELSNSRLKKNSKYI